jgi:hypothetical protein
LPTIIIHHHHPRRCPTFVRRAGVPQAGQGRGCIMHHRSSGTQKSKSKQFFPPAAGVLVFM